jgi:TRAP-type C4-dicarboxylate transport system substrate-binding protein
LKRVVISMLTMLLILGTVLVGCTTTEPEEGELEQPGEEPVEVQHIEWRMASFVPATDCFSRFVTSWGDYMTEQTGGRFKLFTYWADSLVKGAGLVDAVESGTADMCMMTTSGHSERLPFAQAFALMGQPLETGAHGSEVIIRLMQWLQDNYPQYADRFYGHTKLMWLNVPIPRSTIVSNVPFHTLADLKGRKFTATVAEDIKGFSLLGASTVPLFTGDMYMGLQTNLIDGIHGDWTMFYLWRLYEPSKYRTTNTIRKGASYPTNCNIDAYNKLPADVKAIFDSSIDPLKRSVGQCLIHRAQDIYFQDYIEQWEADHGNPPVYTLPNDESKKWNDLVKPVIQGWIDNTDKMGLPGTEFWAEFEKLSNQYQAEAAGLVADAVKEYLPVWENGQDAQFYDWDFVNNMDIQYTPLAKPLQ